MAGKRLWSIHRVAARDLFFADYCRMRIALWPDCAEECEAEALRFVANRECGAAFVAVTGASEPIGFIEVSLRSHAESASISPVPFIEGWFVESAHRGLGAGRALVDAAEEWALEQGYLEIGSDTQLENTGSIAAHLHLGFREVERNVCFLKQLR